MDMPYSPHQTIVIKTVEAISILFDSRQRKALLPFINCENSISKAAQTVQELPNTMLYRVKRWEKLGLLQNTRSIPSQKGSIRLFGSSAKAFFVPYSATTAEDLITLAKDTYTPIFTDFLQAYVHFGENLSPTWGIHFSRQNDQWLIRPVKSVHDECLPEDTDSPATMLSHQQLQLDSSAAKAMQLELLSVVNKYSQQNSSKGKTYQVLLGIA
jgi:hypothetical protein